MNHRGDGRSVGTFSRRGAGILTGVRAERLFLGVRFLLVASMFLMTAGCRQEQPTKEHDSAPDTQVTKSDSDSTAGRLDEVDRSSEPVTASVAQVVSAAAATPETRESEPAAKEVIVPDPRQKQMQPQILELLTRRREAVVRDPADVDAWMEYGVACDAHKLFDCAEACYRRSLVLKPNDFTATYFLAYVLDSIGRGDDECVELYRAAARIEPKYPPLFYRLGKALERRDNLPEALDAYLGALNVDYRYGPAHRALGQIQVAKGEKELALKHLRYAVQLAPRNRASMSALESARARFGMAPLFASTKIQDDTTLEVDIPDLVRDIVKETALDSPSLLRRAKAMIHAGEHAEAIPNLKIVERATPGDSYVHLYLGTCYHRTGNLGLAAAHLKTSVRLKEDSAGAQAEYATLLVEIGRLEEGLHHYDLAVSYTMSPRDIHIWMGGTLFAKGNMKYAVEAYESAFNIASLDSMSFSRWATALFGLGDYDGAVDKYQKATVINSGFVDAFYNWGISLEKLGKLAEAATQYEKVLSLEPDHPRAGKRLDAVTMSQP